MTLYPIEGSQYELSIKTHERFISKTHRTTCHRFYLIVALSPELAGFLNGSKICLRLPHFAELSTLFIDLAYNLDLESPTFQYISHSPDVLFNIFPNYQIYWKIFYFSMIMEEPSLLKNLNTTIPF